MTNPIASDARPTNVRWWIILLLMSFAALGHFDRVSISVAGSDRLIGSEGISEQQMGLVYSAFLLTYTLCMLPGGWLIDRVGPTAALTWMGLGLGTCVALTGALGWMGWSGQTLWLALLIVRGIAGAASVPLHPGAAHSVSLWMPAHGRATANGLVTAAALVGIALTYPGFGWLMDRLDWPLAFVVCGAATIALAIVWHGLAADGAAAHPRANAAERALVLGQEQMPASRGRSTIRGSLASLCSRSLILLTLSYAAVGYFQYLFFYWMQYYFEQQLKLPKTEGREAAFLVTMAMALGMAGGGWCADRLCRRWGPCWGRRSMAIVGMGLSALFAVIGVSAGEPEQVVLCFSLALGALGLCEGVFWTTATDLGPRSRGLACALVNTGGNGGGALAPSLTPWLAEQFGWTTAIGVACCVCGVGSLLWLGIDNRSRGSRG